MGVLPPLDRLNRDECAANVKRSDLNGQRFGHWTVIARANSTKHGATQWGCRCDCGGAAEVRADALKIGASTCCGACDNRGFRDTMLARDLRHIEWKRKLRAAIAKRVQGLTRTERLAVLTDLARQAAEARK
jgi:hypothetical protein